MASPSFQEPIRVLCFCPLPAFLPSLTIQRWPSEWAGRGCGQGRPPHSCAQLASHWSPQSNSGLQGKQCRVQLQDWRGKVVVNRRCSDLAGFLPVHFSLRFKKDLFIFACDYFTCVCTCVHHVGAWYLWHSEQGVRCHGTRVMGGYELLCKCWNQTSFAVRAASANTYTDSPVSSSLSFFLSFVFLDKVSFC